MSFPERKHYGKQREALLRADVGEAVMISLLSAVTHTQPQDERGKARMQLFFSLNGHFKIKRRTGDKSKQTRSSNENIFVHVTEVICCC